MEKTELKKFDARQWYASNFELFESRLDGSKTLPFHGVRKAAISRFSELGFPTPRDEEWKYTNVAPILGHKFKMAMEPAKLNKASLQPFMFEGLKEHTVVFVNGHYAPELSNLEPSSKGLVIESLKDAVRSHPEILEKYLGKYAKFDEETFTALNTAFTYDGSLVYAPEGTVVEEPIHFINLSVAQDDEFVSYPRNLYVMEKGSKARIIDTYHYLAENTYFTNAVTEVFLDEEAQFDHIKIQDESKSAYHISNNWVHQERASIYTSINIDLGGALVRNNTNTVLNDERGETHLFGFYFGDGNQHVDNHTFMDHAKPNCFSNELYKGVLGGKARGVFNGKILVRQDAQKTNALQSNKTLLLTEDATINAKPQLEIFADDVKCTHGATIGQLDEEAMFYLRSRGISEEMVGAMLRYAFAADVFENIKIEPVRKKLDERLIDVLKYVESEL